MANSISIVVKDGKFFIFSEIAGKMGGTTPAPVFRVETVDDGWSDEQLGRLIAGCISHCSQFLEVEGWDNPRALDVALNKFGYSSFADLRRESLWIYVEGEGGIVTVYPSKRLGKRSPTFEGLKEIVIDSGLAEDLGEGIRRAISLSS